jgi:hypothetical protein
MAGYPAGFPKPEIIFFLRVNIGVIEKSGYLVAGLKEANNIESIRSTAQMSQNYGLIIHTAILAFF